VQVARDLVPGLASHLHGSLCVYVCVLRIIVYVCVCVCVCSMQVWTYMMLSVCACVFQTQEQPPYHRGSNEQHPQSPSRTHPACISPLRWQSDPQTYLLSHPHAPSIMRQPKKPQTLVSKRNPTVQHAWYRNTMLSNLACILCQASTQGDLHTHAHLACKLFLLPLTCTPSLHVIFTSTHMRT
jgi:hypothetical protein